MLVNAAPLIEALKGKTHELDFEYGMCQFEYKTPPTPMHNLLNLNTHRASECSSAKSIQE
jgi:hypothetical protein